jgi:FMN-dependent NADH-azoreductase
MPNLLKIDVSPRGGHSISRALGTIFASAWSEHHSDGKLIERDLARTDLPFVELPWIMAAYSDSATHDAEQRAALAIGNDLIAELKSADQWLITTPMYNFAIPARLKAYIDHIVRSGQTFKTNADGSFTGLLKGKKVTVIVASAGEYTTGSPTEAYDDVKPYLTRILSVIGVTDVTFVQAGSTWKVDSGIADREAYLASHSDLVALLATPRK